MKTVVLYTGNGVSLSPINADGRQVSQYVRLVAEEGMAITNGILVTACADVPTSAVDCWTDCPLDAELEPAPAL